MTFFEKTNPEQTRVEPRVWVQRLTLYESLEPLLEIRTVELHPGINIIWGLEGDLADGNFQPGHGVGKTTFCRLIRYCLGEDSFGQRHAVKEIRYSFADGYVAADVRVENRTWSVLRPLGENHRTSYATSDSCISELIRDRPKNSFPAFRSHLATTCLKDVGSSSVLTGGESVTWDHLLAMCARDQEARYDRFWNWRNSRSDSGTPKFRQPKIDASLCVRALLHLLPDDETTLRVRAQTLSEELDRIDAAIPAKKAEPTFQVRQLRRALQDDFGVERATDAPLDADDLFGLPRLVAHRIEQLEDVRRGAAAAQPSLDRQISLAAASLLEPAELQAEEAVAAEVTDSGTAALLRGIQELRNFAQKFSDVENSLCTYGQISIGNCEYAKYEVGNVSRELRELQRTDIPEIVEREQVSTALSERSKRREEVVQELREKLDELTKRRNEIVESRLQADKAIHDLNACLERLQVWDAILNGKVPDSDVAELVEIRNCEIIPQELDDRAKRTGSRSTANI
jgi:hypothetical protein